jgi:hypothetical protein
MEETLLQRNSAYHESHMKSHGIELGASELRKQRLTARVTAQRISGMFRHGYVSPKQSVEATIFRLGTLMSAYSSLKKKLESLDRQVNYIVIMHNLTEPLRPKT